MFIPSPHQETIFDWAENGQGHAVINAVAGSGKTTTLVELLKKIKGNVQFLAFNKHIATELEKRAPVYVQVNTTNSFGNRVFRMHVSGARFDRFKTWNILERKVLRSNEQHMFKMIRNQVTQLVSLYKAGYNGSTFPDLVELMDFHGITFPEKLPYSRCVEIAIAAAVEAISDTMSFDFDDQIFMPVYHNMSIPTFDWVCVDESQDLNAVQLELLGRMLSAKGRLVAVGDPHQAIYMFRGANVDSMAQIKQRFNATSLPLSVCYRCPIAVVKEAKKLVPHIEWCSTAEEGNVTTIPISEFDPSTGEFVLCRTTAPLVRECLRAIRMGKTACVKGRDIGAGLLTLYKSIGVGSNVMASLEQYRTLQMVRLKDKPDSVKVAVNDQIDTLVAICEHIEEETNEGQHTGNTFFASMELMIERLFSDTKSRGIQFSTIHRSKGEEYEHVYIIRPDLLPHPKCLEGPQREQEDNLKYVGITRARNTLTWVEGERH